MAHRMPAAAWHLTAVEEKAVVLTGLSALRAKT